LAGIRQRAGGTILPISAKNASSAFMSEGAQPPLERRKQTVPGAEVRKGGTVRTFKSRILQVTPDTERNVDE